MNIKSFQAWVIGCSIFLLPLFFLPFTQDIFGISKQYLLFVTIGVLCISSLISVIVDRKLTSPFVKSDIYPALFLLIYLGSLIFVSPNKIQAVITPMYGFGTLISLFTLAVYIRIRKVSLFQPLLYSAFFGSVLVIVFAFLKPFATTQMAPILSFLKDPLFTPIGSQLETLLFLSVTALLSVGTLMHEKKKNSSALDSSFWIHLVMVCIVCVGIITSGRMVIKNNLIRPPLQTSWDAAIETLKTPKTLLLGAGIDNYMTAFTLAKRPSYNNGLYWRDNFRTASSPYLHVWTETGVFSFLLFMTWVGLLVATRLKKGGFTDATLLAFLGILIAGLLTPMTFIWLLLLFIFIGSVERTAQEPSSINLSIASASFFVLLIGIGMIGDVFLLSRNYAGEVWYRQALLNSTSATMLYEYHRNAIRSNPYNERYRVSFSQVNLLIANSIAQKKDLSPAEKQTVTQAIQQSIAEGKAAIQLNPQRPGNWANLAGIYKSILGVAKGSDAWAVSTYQRAILLDPMNPNLRLNLGGVFYTLKRYPQAIELFKQAIQLKSNIANYHYNLAWAYFQNKEYGNAVLSMNTALSLLPDKKSEDHKRAQKEFEQFKKKADEEKVAADAKMKAAQENVDRSTQSGEIDPLSVPTPLPSGSQQINLPREAQPPLPTEQKEATSSGN